MGFRFRRTIKIAPGIKLNLSKSGVSTTMGKRGLTTTLGKNGAYLNAGVPGTGMSGDRSTSLFPVLTPEENTRRKGHCKPLETKAEWTSRT